MFCNKCRRRILFRKTKKKIQDVFNQYSITEDFIIIFSDNPQAAKIQYINQVAKNKMVCPACKEELSKNFKVKLGVSERIDVISTYEKSIHPDHRPHYINAVPLIDIIRSIKNIKSTTSKSVLNEYNKIIEKLGTEFEILIDLSLDEIENFDKNIGSIIKAFRNNEIEYTPGGGGTYGQIKLVL